MASNNYKKLCHYRDLGPTLVGRCSWCLRPISALGGVPSWTEDAMHDYTVITMAEATHTIPQSLGGREHHDDVRSGCYNCNKAMADRIAPPAVLPVPPMPEGTQAELVARVDGIREVHGIRAVAERDAAARQAEWRAAGWEG